MGLAPFRESLLGVAARQDLSCCLTRRKRKLSLINLTVLLCTYSSANMMISTCCGLHAANVSRRQAGWNRRWDSQWLCRVTNLSNLSNVAGLPVRAVVHT